MFRFPLLALLGILVGCSATRLGVPMGEVAPEINTTLTRDQRVLSAGDVLSVRFPRQSQWDQDDIVVLGDGRVSFLSLDDMAVAGLTLEQLDSKLTKEYSKVLAQPELTVRTTQIAPSTISILGEVQQPGSFPLPPGRLSLPEAIGLAGGFVRDSALPEQTLLVRWISDEGRIRSWVINAEVGQWGAEESILLQAHDVIFIPAQSIVHIDDWIDRYLRRLIPFPYLVTL